MKRLAVLALLFGPALFARSAETLYFRAVMLPSNEVPSVDIAASGAATIRAHVVRDDSGQITDGSVDFLVDYAFPGPVTFTGLHIHSGAAGVNGPVTINSGISASNPFDGGSGRGSIVRQGQVQAGNQDAVATLRGMANDPASYYVNLHTTEFPGGAIRGQLQRAEATVFIGVMSSANEVPPAGIDASGISSVLVLVTRDATGAPATAQMIFDTNYRFPGQVTFTGYHIHGGPAGVNAPVIFNSGIGSGAASVDSAASGTGNLNRALEVDLSQATQAEALAGLLVNPAAFYINLHTTQFPGGAIRAQLRRTDRMAFDVTMLPSNEVPPVTLEAGAPARFVAHTIRHEDGNVQAAAVEFDVNFRFPGAAEFTGLHIHDGAAGVNGPVMVDSGLSRASSVTADTGFGNIFRLVTVSDAPALATVNSLVANPENHYINLHTIANPGGAVRAQLAAATSARPAISSVISANLDRGSTTVAPGGLISIFGTNLAKTTADLSGWDGARIPDILNGVAVAAGGARARLVYVSPTQVNAALAFDTPAGTQPVIVNNGNGPGAPATVTVAPVAPAVFFAPSGGIVLKNSDFSLVRAGNAARAGDVLVIFATGLGQTTPALETGRLAPTTPAAVAAPVAVTIGGRDAEVISSVASPGFVGLYQIAVRMPAGLAAGNAPVVVRSGQAASNTVNVAVE